MSGRLFHSVDRVSQRADKYVEHGTPIVRLVPPALRRVLLRMAKES